jgi:hypothetical protein
MASETQTCAIGILANRRNPPKIELCSTLSLSKGLPCVTFCEAGSSLSPLHLSRTLYKSTLFMQNKANFRKSQMNVNPYNTKDYENKSDWTLGENKPKQTQTKPIFKSEDRRQKAEYSPRSSVIRPRHSAAADKEKTKSVLVRNYDELL